MEHLRDTTVSTITSATHEQTTAYVIEQIYDFQYSPAKTGGEGVDLDSYLTLITASTASINDTATGASVVQVVSLFDTIPADTGSSVTASIMVATTPSLNSVSRHVTAASPTSTSGAGISATHDAAGRLLLLLWCMVLLYG